MSPAFAPSLGRLVAASARRPLSALWDEPAELARLTLELARRAGATHILFPFDALVAVEAAGAPLRWSDDEPHPAAGVDLRDAEPAALTGAARWPRALEATRYMGALHPLAALVPSPGLLVEQAGGPADEDEWLEAAEDISAALARGLLEAGAVALVVEAARGEPVDTTSGLERIAELFGAECHRAGVARVTLADAGAAPREARIVLTAGPLEPGTDLGAVAALAQSLARG